MRIVIITTLLVILFFFFFAFALGKHEDYECEKWEAQAEKYDNFYYTDWQKEQCK